MVDALPDPVPGPPRPPRALRTRRIAAGVLAVLGAVLLAFGSLGWWLEREFLDTQNFTDTANQVLETSSVQTALTTRITHRITTSSNRRAVTLAEPFIASVVGTIVSSNAFEKIFDVAVSRAHHAVVEKGARDVVLDLSDTVTDLKSALNEVAPNLAKKIPSGEAVQVKVLDKTQLNTVWGIIDAVKKGVLLIFLGGLALLAVALALAPFRWRTLALTGWVLLGTLVTLLLVVFVARALVSNRAASSDAAEATMRILTRGFVVQSVVIAVLAAILAVAAGWTDRHGGAAAWEREGRRLWAWARERVPTRPAEEAPAAVPAPVGAAAEGAAIAVPEAAVAPVAPAPAGARAVGFALPTTAAGLLAFRLPAPARNPRAVHAWRAVGLLALGLFAIFFPTSITNLVVIVLGLAVVYLAGTEGLASWHSPPASEAEETETADGGTPGAGAADGSGRDAPDTPDADAPDAG